MEEELNKELKKDNSMWMNFLLPLNFIAFNLLINAIGFLWIGMSIIPKYFLIDFSFIVLIASVIFLIPNRKVKIIFSTLFILLAIGINITNACLYKVFGDIFYVQMLKLTQETLHVLDLSYFDFPAIITYIAVFVGYIFMTIYLNRYLKKNQAFYKSNFKHVFSTFVISLIMITYTFSISQVQIRNQVQAEGVNMTNDCSQYETLFFKYSSLEKFGFYGFYFKEFSNFLFDTNLMMSGEEKETAINTVAEGHYNDTTATNYGLLKDDNLICILTESMEWFAIDPYYTPTLYNLYYNDSVCLKKYYSKNKTNVSEGIINFGFMPSSFNLSATINGEDFNNPYTLANMFNNRGYDSEYYHSFVDYFYDRNALMPKMGYNDLHFFNTDDIGYKADSFSNIGSDYDFFNALKDQMIPTDEKFFVSYATMSTHATYDVKKKHIAECYENYEDETMWNNLKTYMQNDFNYNFDDISSTELTYFKNYKAGAIDLDRTLRAMLDDLEVKNLLDTTTIVMFSDHNAYGNNMGFLVKGIEHHNFYENEVYHVPALIYSEKLEAQQITTFTNTYDVYKTIVDLFALDSNSALINGYNVFDSEKIQNSFFVSFTCGMMKDNFYSKDFDKIYYTDGTLVEDETQINTFVDYINKFYTRQLLIDQIYKNNLLADYKIELHTDGTSSFVLK